MIERHDIYLKEGEVTSLANDVKLSVLKQIGSRPSAISIRTEGGEVEIPDFAGGRYRVEASGLLPTCEVVIWNGIVFIAGLPSIVVAGNAPLLECSLFRKADEDTGFYTTEWVEVGTRLFCVYESGIMAWNNDGTMLWHTRKSWDDVFIGIEPDGLVLMMQDGQKILITQADGLRKLKDL